MTMRVSSRAFTTFSFSNWLFSIAGRRRGTIRHTERDSKRQYEPDSDAWMLLYVFTNPENLATNPFYNEKWADGRFLVAPSFLESIYACLQLTTHRGEPHRPQATVFYSQTLILMRPNLYHLRHLHNELQTCGLHQISDGQMLPWYNAPDYPYQTANVVVHPCTACKNCKQV